jgi:hypothetical protein
MPRFVAGKGKQIRPCGLFAHFFLFEFQKVLRQLRFCFQRVEFIVGDFVNRYSFLLQYHFVQCLAYVKRPVHRVVFADDVLGAFHEIGGFAEIVKTGQSILAYRPFFRHLDDVARAVRLSEGIPRVDGRERHDPGIGLVPAEIVQYCVARAFDKVVNGL